MRDTSFLGFGYQPATPDPVHVVANHPKGQTATDKVRQWLQTHAGFHTIAEISAATGVSIHQTNSAVSNLYQRHRITREHQRTARRVEGQPQRYAWKGER